MMIGNKSLNCSCPLKREASRKLITAEDEFFLCCSSNRCKNNFEQQLFNVNHFKSNWSWKEKLRKFLIALLPFT
jgi:hypothetical protein